MPTLFTPDTLRSVTFRDRIVVSPMCNYVAVHGILTDWHRVHYASLARGGAGLVVVEASAVSQEGRITPGDSGIWNDAQAAVLSEIAASIAEAGAVPGIQPAHAGRKASANRPWEGDDSIPEADPRGEADLVAFGRFVSSNPDLPELLRLGIPLAAYNRDAFWGGDKRGYTDFPPGARGREPVAAGA